MTIANRNGAPMWALGYLRALGYRPSTPMDRHVSEWWQWYTSRGKFYEPADCKVGAERHMSVHPARKVCDEWASLTVDEHVAVSSPDGALNGWLAERMGDVLAGSADLVSRAFALGTGAWVLDFSGLADEGYDSHPAATARVRSYDAGFIMPLVSDGQESVSCAFARRVEVGGREYDQLQVHEPVGGIYHIRTWLFAPGRYGEPVRAEGVVPDLCTNSYLRTYALVRPNVANTYEDDCPLGVSVFDDGIDALKAVDEAFDLLYWSLRLGKPRVFADEQAMVYDDRTGAVMSESVLDERLLHLMRGGVGQYLPLTVYTPDLRVEDCVRAINAALSILSFECGFGAGYFSFDRHQGLKTATEVVADNSQLMRHLRKHEALLGESLSGIARGAYAAELGLRGGAVVPAADVPGVEVVWDDSAVEDTKAARDLMKDDIARGLCPAWMYPMRYYGMSEEDARAFVDGVPGQEPEEY